MLHVPETCLPRNIRSFANQYQYQQLSRQTLLRYVRLMSSQIRLSAVCLSSVTLVHPTQRVELFGNIFPSSSS